MTPTTPEKILALADIAEELEGTPHDAAALLIDAVAMCASSAGMDLAELHTRLDESTATMRSAKTAVDAIGPAAASRKQ
ncbi:hypothetical protein K7H20_18770 [Salipiger manganoxidans]|uniref:hypothetical protein n=1 Tax=Salipiger marinus TaxID=555512 RepID=UPI001E570D51|nr:hypothetical protein [Salipiger manganoxidans]MCD1620104.1 hypothetical protein [Salipiger manganoxidans]